MVTVEFTKDFGAFKKGEVHQVAEFTFELLESKGRAKKTTKKVKAQRKAKTKIETK